MPFIGEVRLTGFSFAPTGWALCNGQILPIGPNTALFSVLGTTYGGNGVSTFALPNLQGRIPVGAGQGLGLTHRDAGETGGVESYSLGLNELPSHSHTLRASSSNGTTDQPGGNLPARNPSGIPGYATAADGNAAAAAVGSVGSGQPHNNLQPYIVVNYIICLSGTFP